MDQIQAIVLNFIRSLFPATIWNWNYFTGLWDKYANFGGFIIGAVVVGMVYFASDSEDGKKRGIFRVFAVVALINAIDGIYILIMNLVNSLVFHNVASQYEANIHGAFNPLSLILLVLVISECYRNKPRQAFFFGLSTFSVSILMFGSGYTDDMVLLYLFVRVSVIAIICAICSKLTYAFVSYLVTGLYFVISEAAQSYIIYFIAFSGEKGFAKDILTILASYRAEYIILCFIVFVFALFEIVILTEGKMNVKNLALGKAVSVVLLSATLLVALYVVMFKTDLTGQLNQTTDSNINYTENEIYAPYAEASSYLTADSGNSYGAEYTIDGSNDTCWQDGQDGDGVGETLTYTFETPVLLDKIYAINGRVQSEDKYYENNRLSDATVYYYLDDTLVAEQTLSFDDECNTDASVFDLDEKVECNRVVLEVTGIYNGSAYQDLCITDVYFEELVQE